MYMHIWERSEHTRRPQVTKLLHALRDAITVTNQRLPCLVVCFVAQGLGITVRPAHG